MKRLILIISLVTVGVCGYAQSAEEQEMAADTIVKIAEADTVLSYTQDELDKHILDFALSWLDTTECTGGADTTSLPDSVYIARLRSLPYIIEMPYNTVV